MSRVAGGLPACMCRLRTCVKMQPRVLTVLRNAARVLPAGDQNSLNVHTTHACLVCVRRRWRTGCGRSHRFSQTGCDRAACALGVRQAGAPSATLRGVMTRARSQRQSGRAWKKPRSRCGRLVYDAPQTLQCRSHCVLARPHVTHCAFPQKKTVLCMSRQLRPGCTPVVDIYLSNTDVSELHCALPCMCGWCCAKPSAGS